MEHSDDITAMAMSSDGKTVATGEIGPKPLICIWDAVTMKPLHCLKGKLTKGIQGLSFSPSGNTLAAVAIDNDHHVGLFDVKTGAPRGISKNDGNRVLDIAMKSDSEFVSVGLKHFKTWTLNSGALQSKRGLFGKYDNRVLCCEFAGDMCIAGTLGGSILVWNSNSVSNHIQGTHTRPVDAIHVNKNFVFTGSRDGTVVILSIQKKLSEVMKFSMADEQFGSVDPGLNAFCLH